MDVILLGKTWRILTKPEDKDDYYNDLQYEDDWGSNEQESEDDDDTDDPSDGDDSDDDLD